MEEEGDAMEEEKDSKEEVVDFSMCPPAPEARNTISPGPEGWTDDETLLSQKVELVRQVAEGGAV
jgi:hypothetical protein